MTSRANADAQPEIDIEMRAWLMIHAASKTPPGLFGRKRAEKELRGCLKDLGVSCFIDGEEPVASQEEHGIERQRAFAKRYISLCLKSRQYGSTLMNLVPLSDAATAEKLKREITDVTYTYPSLFGLDTACEELREAMLAELGAQTATE